MQENQTIDTGRLQVHVTDSTGITPIKDALVEIFDPSTPNLPIEQIKTDSSGNTESIELLAPPVEFSQFPSDNQPFSEYNLRITAKNYEEAFVSNISILPDQTGFQQIALPTEQNNTYTSPIVLSGNTLWEYYPPKIAEDSIKPLSETGSIVLSRVVIPETIVVHDGVPSDKSAKDYYVPYLDYIKNVASSEIYATWPKETIRANILAIMSFTLNRVYTEWYRNKGYNFTITSSTAYDHKWILGQTIFESIAREVDALYNRYLAKPNVKQPILTQYCDGKRVTCPNWMSQWGSKALGDDGLSALDIIRYYYGDSFYIATAENIAGIPSSYPGSPLKKGSSSGYVKTIQNQLNEIAKKYPAIPRLDPDGIFGSKTETSVKKFQEIFNLPVSGVVDFPTWYKISQIYVGVTKIGENL